jgi:hypothetical protein
MKIGHGLRIAPGSERRKIEIVSASRRVPFCPDRYTCGYTSAEFRLVSIKARELGPFSTQRDGRAVDGGGLENHCAPNDTDTKSYGGLHGKLRGRHRPIGPANVLFCRKRLTMSATPVATMLPRQGPIPADSG